MSQPESKVSSPANYHPDYFSELVFQKKYQGVKETIYDVFDELVDRISTQYEGVKETVSHDTIMRRLDNLKDSLYNRRFIFGGRILAAAGAERNRKVSYYNCTNINILDDSWEGISEAMYKVGKVSSRGQGVGIDFSALRPRLGKVNNAARSSTGAVSFMRLFDALGNTIAQDGDGNKPGRRMAMLFTLEVSHPDIEEFISCKQVEGSVTNANISILITKAFLDAVEAGSSWDLTFNGTVYKTVDARELMRKISESNRTSAEPGMLFIENAKANALPNELGFPIVGFNACTEAVLDYAGVCNLGSLNLSAYWGSKDDFGIYWNRLSSDIYSAVAALDGIVSLEFSENRAPITEQEVSQKALRRIGLGVMGLADLLALNGMVYGSKEAIEFTDKLMEFIANVAFQASASLAGMLGSCDAIKDASIKQVLSHPFIDKLWDTTKTQIQINGLRNAAIISIAPTGSISNIVGCSSGIEPLFALQYERKTRLSGEWETIDYKHPVYEAHPEAAWVITKEVNPQDKLKMVAAVQKWVDQSIANTGNFAADTTAEQIEEYYFNAFKMGAKGLTVYVSNQATAETRGAILTEVSSEEEFVPSDMELYQGVACKIDLETGETHCD